MPYDYFIGTMALPIIGAPIHESDLARSIQQQERNGFEFVQALPGINGRGITLIFRKPATSGCPTETQPWIGTTEDNNGEPC